jgi:enoyl-CoA hydratase/carnithine racemase
MELGSTGLRVERRRRTAWCTVDNPDRPKTMSDEMYTELGKLIDAVEADAGLDALVVTGAGDVFIAGGDPATHTEDADQAEDVDLPFAKLHRTGLPVVAAINGHCQASGVWFAVLADVAIASDRARFRLPELRLGVAAPWSSAILPAVVGLAWAKDLALTSRSISAAEALEIGLISRVVPHDELADAAERVVAELLEAAPAARAAWKAAVHEHISTIDDRSVGDSIRTPEANEGFAAYAERRPPNWSSRHPRRAGTQKDD